MQSLVIGHLNHITIPSSHRQLHTPVEGDCEHKVPLGGGVIRSICGFLHQ